MARTPDIAAENFAAADAFASAPRGVGVEVGRVERQPFILFRGPWWIVMVAAGLATIAGCILLPLREENRHLAHALADVQQEADFVARQTAANDAFLKQIHSDPALVERVAMRMTNRPAAGMKFLDGRADDGRFASSPYQLTELAAPAPLQAYRSDLPLPIRALFLDKPATSPSPTAAYAEHPRPRTILARLSDAFAQPRFIMLVGGIVLLASALVLGGKTERPV